MFKAFFVGLYHRLWLSYRSTLLGLLVAAAGEALAYFGSAAGVPPYIHALIALAATPFLAWKDQAVKSGTIKLLVVLFLLSGAAQAQTTEPSTSAPACTASRFGGCIGPWVSLAPAVVVVPLAINLRTKVIEAGFQPGLCYGVSVHSEAWWGFGGDVCGDIDVGTQTARISFMASALSGWLRVGWGRGWIGDSNATAPRLLFGIGTAIP